MNKREIIILVLLVVILSSFAMRMRVVPGTILMQEAPVGETYDFAESRGQSITIGPVERDGSYLLMAQPASEGGCQATGFYDFPNADWFILAADSVYVEQGKATQVPMWLEIPDNEGYYNHHWLLGISVNSSVAGLKGNVIQPGVYLLFRFETESNPDAVPVCAQEEIVCAPSALKLSELHVGDTVNSVLKLYQGNTMARLYTVSRLDPTSDVAKLTIKGTPGFPRLSNPEWVEYPDTIVIPGVKEGAGVFPVTVNIPSGSQVRRFEEILMIEGVGSRPAFIRILVSIAQE